MDAVEELPEGELFVSGAVVEGLEQGVQRSGWVPHSASRRGRVWW
ncbi:hypothetical protein [Streptomyces mirabilis]